MSTDQAHKDQQIMAIMDLVAGDPWGQACAVTGKVDCKDRDCELHYMDAPLKLADDDHKARPDDDPEPGDRCKDCGKDITWLGPSYNDWEHC